MVILTWLETIESTPSVSNVLMEKTGKIGSTVLAAVNGTTRDASMFQFMTFVLKFGIFYLMF